MADMRTIEIDFEIHKRIEAERRSFSETDNTILRRLIGIRDAIGATPANGNAAARGWLGDSVKLPHGTELRMKYNGRLHTGKIDNGDWFVEGVRYNSPSAAAGGVARTKKGDKTSLDGWNYWEAKLPGETNWKAIKRMRWL